MQRIILSVFMIFLTTAAPAWVCISNSFSWDNDWLSAWRNHNGWLPNGSMVGSSAGPWSVSSDLSSPSNRTVYGDGWCGSHNQEAPPGAVIDEMGGDPGSCWCRMTAPIFGAWVFLGNWHGGVQCSELCASDCAECVITGDRGSCTRATVLGGGAGGNINWLEAWRNHSGPLPNALMSDWDFDMWEVTSDLGGAGNQTVSGEISCDSFGGWESSNCLCRMTSPHVGQWVSVGDVGDQMGCALGCSWHCAQCVISGAHGCPRAAILN